MADTCLVWEPCQQSGTFGAHHAGLTGAKMRVPMILVERGRAV